MIRIRSRPTRCLRFCAGERPEIYSNGLDESRSIAVTISIQRILFRLRKYLQPAVAALLGARGSPYYARTKNNSGRWGFSCRRGKTQGETPHVESSLRSVEQ